MQIKINKRAVDAAQPGVKDFFLWDTEDRGFGLKVCPSGKKVYLVQVRHKGRVRRFTIGPHGRWTPDQARKEARVLLGQLAQGIDPAAQKRRDEAQSMTVAKLCDVYLAEGVSTKKESTIAIDRGRIARHIKPALGRIPMRELTRADIERARDDIASGKYAVDEKTGPRGRARVTGGQGTATRALGLLGAILQFAVDREWLEMNPARGVKSFKDRKVQRLLTSTEMGDLARALENAEGESPYAVAAIRLLMFTGCRKGEILNLRWDYVDLERGMLNLPDTKTGHREVFLSPPAIDLMKALPRMAGNPHVICGDKPGAPLVNLRKPWVRIQTAAGLSGIRLHDLRHTFASMAAGSGHSLQMIARLLGHRDLRTSQRYATLTEDPVRRAGNATAEAISAAMERKPTAKVLEIRKTR